jgi:hypothetical protein
MEKIMTRSKTTLFLTLSFIVMSYQAEGTSQSPTEQPTYNGNKLVFGNDTLTPSKGYNQPLYGEVQGAPVEHPANLHADKVKKQANSDYKKEK